MNDLLAFVNTWGWFRQLTTTEQANIKAFMRMLAYAEGTSPDWTSAINAENSWRLIQGAPYYKKFINEKTLQHPECCNAGCAKGNAVGWFQIEGPTWGDDGFCGKPLTKENQINWFLGRLKKLYNVYDTTFAGKNKYKNVAGISGTSAYADVCAGRFKWAIMKVRGRWKSLPGSGGRHIRFSNISEAINKVVAFGGVYIQENK